MNLFFSRYPQGLKRLPGHPDSRPAPHVSPDADPAATGRQERERRGASSLADSIIRDRSEALSGVAISRGLEASRIRRLYALGLPK